jgi:hypothetical protein
MSIVRRGYLEISRNRTHNGGHFQTTKKYYTFEIIGKYYQLHDEKLHNLIYSPIITGVMKSGRKRWAGHVARMTKMRIHKGFGMGWIHLAHDMDHRPSYVSTVMNHNLIHLHPNNFNRD